MLYERGERFVLVNVVLMSDQAEHAFVKAFVNILASQPVTFDNDFQEQPANTLKRVPVLSVCALNIAVISRPFRLSRSKCPVLPS
jgi:hypothetical protein